MANLPIHHLVMSVPQLAVKQGMANLQKPHSTMPKPPEAVQTQEKQTQIQEKQTQNRVGGR